MVSLKGCEINSTDWGKREEVFIDIKAEQKERPDKPDIFGIDT